MNMKKIVALIVIVVIILGGVAWWIFHPRPNDRQQIDQLISRVEKGIEDRNSHQIMSCVSKDYSDSVGINYSRISLLAARLQQTTGKIVIDITDFQEPRIEGDTAKMQLTVKIVVADETMNGTVGGPVELTMKRDRGEWKIQSASGWQEWAQSYIGF
jgi:hypothetical protein